jgi:hypothetical protein
MVTTPACSALTEPDPGDFRGADQTGEVEQVGEAPQEQIVGIALAVTCTIAIMRATEHQCYHAAFWERFCPEQQERTFRTKIGGTMRTVKVSCSQVQGLTCDLEGHAIGHLAFHLVCDKVASQMALVGH